MASRILVFGASQSMQLLLTKCLTANQHEVVAASSAADAAHLLEEASPDVVLGDASGVPLADVLRELLTKRPGQSSAVTAPILLLDRDATPGRRVEALVAGARDLIAWPVNQRLLLARLRGVLREVHAMRETKRRDAAALTFGFSEAPDGFTGPRTIAFVAPEGPEATFPTLDGKGLSARIIRLTPAEALSATGEAAPVDAFVLDGKSLHKTVSFNILPELRAREHSRHAGILFIHDADDDDLAATALDSGASDILAGDAREEELKRRLVALLDRKTEEDALRRSSENSYRAAATDELTGLYNRRYAQKYLRDALTDAAPPNEAVTTMIVDIDHFKRINDTHGHAAGDAVLVEVARRMKDNLRTIDMVARYGGEEFLVVLPGTELSKAGPAADRLRRMIGSVP
ncbi:MAG: diguanylate cyclase, partial [Pseudomonadota bacterium]